MNQKSNVSNPLFAALEWLNKPFNVSSRREAGLPLTGRQRAFAKTVEQEALQRLKLPTKVNYISEPRDVIRTLLPVGKAPRFRINLSSTNPFIAAHEIGHGMNDRSLARVLSVNPIAGVIDGLLGTGKPMNAGLDRQWAIRAAVEKNRRLPMTTRQLSYGSAARGGGALLSAAYATR